MRVSSTGSGSAMWLVPRSTPREASAPLRQPRCRPGNGCAAGWASFSRACVDRPKTAICCFPTGHPRSRAASDGPTCYWSGRSTRKARSTSRGFNRSGRALTISEDSARTSFWFREWQHVRKPAASKRSRNRQKYRAARRNRPRRLSLRRAALAIARRNRRRLPTWE